VLVKAVNHPSARTRRVGLAVILTGVALVSTACATGQDAATATNRPAIDATIAHVGAMKLEDISIQAPNVSGRATGTSYYAAGDTVPMTLILVNDGHTTETLTGVSGPFASSAVVATDDLSDPTAVKAGAASIQIGPGASVALGLSNLGVGTGYSPNTLVLRGLTSKSLYAGAVVPLTFTFATAGKVSVRVPVQITPTPNDASIPPAGGTGE
jgi:copper(I)-binding protein